jgi:hypothetical protein
MRMLRRFIDDGLCGGPLAALIGVLMAMQALIGGFGSGAMALASTTGAVICSADGTTHHGDHAAEGDAGHGDMHGSGDAPHSGHSRDCCLTACQINASIHIGIPAKAPQPTVLAAIRPILPLAAFDISVPPARLGVSHPARGPPVLPV